MVDINTTEAVHSLSQVGSYNDLTKGDMLQFYGTAEIPSSVIVAAAQALGVEAQQNPTDRGPASAITISGRENLETLAAAGVKFPGALAYKTSGIAAELVQRAAAIDNLSQATIKTSPSEKQPDMLVFRGTKIVPAHVIKASVEALGAAVKLDPFEGGPGAPVQVRGRENLVILAAAGIGFPNAAAYKSVAPAQPRPPSGVLRL